MNVHNNRKTISIPIENEFWNQISIGKQAYKSPRRINVIEYELHMKKTP